MHLTYRFRLYPFRTQIAEFGRWRHELAFLWNFALAQRHSAWESEHLSGKYLDQQHSLSSWRNFDTDGLGQVPSAVAQHHLQRLDLAYRDFFQR